MLREVVSNEWLTVLLILSIAFVAISKLAFFNRFNDFVALIGNSKYLKIYSKDQKFIDLFDGILFANLIVSLSLFIVIITGHSSNTASNNTELLVKLVTGISLLFLIKTLLERLLGSLFEIDNLMDTYLFQKTSYKNYIGIVLIPINALLLYTVAPSKPIVYAVILLLIAIHVIGLIITFKNHQKLILNNLFYFILYLCALEISPYLILYFLITKL